LKLLDIIENAINKSITYGDALQELKKLRLDDETQEKYEVMLHKLLGNEKSVFRDTAIFFTGIPNNKYLELMEVTIALVRKGFYTPEIAQTLYDTYMLSAPLITYFINEAVSIVRMNNITPEEIAGIGEAYHIVATEMEKKGLREKPEIQHDQEEINAKELTDIDMEESEE
jgi:hypothetical protein